MDKHISYILVCLTILRLILKKKLFNKKVIDAGGGHNGF